MKKEVIFTLVAAAIIVTSVGWSSVLGDPTPDKPKILSDGSDIYNENELQYLSIPLNDTESLNITGEFNESSNITLNPSRLVASVIFSGKGHVSSPMGYARVLAIDSSGNKHLIFGTDSLVLGKTFEAEFICEETCNLGETRIDYIAIEIKDASLTIDGIWVLPSNSKPKNFLSRSTYLANQEDLKVGAWQDRITAKDLGWTADETPVSDLTYEEKRSLLGAGGVPEELPNLQGFEYYKGGVFKMEHQGYNRENSESPSSNLPESWDWRNTHGENWNTPVKSQSCCLLGGFLNCSIATNDICENVLGGEWISCGSCWAFASVAATELLTNIYYNQHVDLDLSEQELVSCTNDGCWGGEVINAQNYIMSDGIVDEECFPYTATDDNCNNRCPYEDIEEWIFVERRDIFYGMVEEKEILKAHIIDGAIGASISNWSHALLLQGYRETEEGTVWIFKNSWGDDWGIEGYAEMLEVPMETITAFTFLEPVESLVNREISCTDNDNDGYCNWGINSSKPGSCPPGCHETIGDCDDSDPNSFMAGDFICGTLECYDGIDNEGDLLVDEEDNLSCSLNPPYPHSPTLDSEYTLPNYIECSDSDGGINYSESSYAMGRVRRNINDYGVKYFYLNKPERCLHTGQLQEWWCRPQDNMPMHDEYDCGLISQVCFDGACVDCGDSDVNVEYPDGINPYEQGTVYLPGEVQETDFCVNSNLLREFYCNSGALGMQDISCDCFEDACQQNFECEPQYECRSDGCGQDPVPEGDAWCEQQYGQDYQCCVPTAPPTCEQLGGVCTDPQNCIEILSETVCSFGEYCCTIEER